MAEPKFQETGVEVDRWISRIGYPLTVTVTAVGFVGWWLWTRFRKPDDGIYELTDSERTDEEI